MNHAGLRDGVHDGFEERLLVFLQEFVQERGIAPVGSGARVMDGEFEPRRLQVRRRNRGRRRLVALALVAAVATGTVLTTTLGSSGNNEIGVSAAEAAADPNAVERELSAYGIDATVLVVPVPPVIANRWFHVFFPPGVQVDPVVWAKLQAQTGIGVAGLRSKDYGDPPGTAIDHMPDLTIPGGLRGPVTLIAGRVADPHDLPKGAVEGDQSNELAPSGAFWCLHLERLHPEAAGRVLAGLGYRVIWVFEDQVSDAPNSPPPGSVITWAWLRSQDTVDVRLAAPEDAARIQRDEGTVVDAGGSAPSWAPACDAG